MIEITNKLVRQLIDSQFPKWKDLTITPVEKSGHDNRTYRLGDEMTIRLPSHERYASAVEKELKWLPVFQPQLSLPIPAPIAKGEPSDEYPLPWSINQWIAGETVSHTNVLDLSVFAEDLATFLRELEAIDASHGIPAGIQNFHRGGNLAVYDTDTRSVIEKVSGHYDPKLMTEIWELALATKYQASPLWLHGDVAVGNLLVQDGRLCGVIDFGTMGVGDPSSDLVIAWNFFDDISREIFLSCMNVDQDTVDRARGWALWKALISYDWNEQGSEASNWGKRVIDVIIRDYTSL
ncbi:MULTISPECIES: aminoglycoside phosphotransferase family protein [Paenibacillus]|uniref:Aminoglycoside phosphotransferase (APT) family kinase protein n=1 Tax=Paenibacillus pabuli TaxID=1472 RepID=A0A855Y6S8_9BACL|nr:MULTISPECIES: aminoglycoside phosphotransferase family protein [Paenibacillus]PWW36048.1 aminoglycoside phosphotransferase (APT) family kinase protein [Paenibacillus pabuli]PXW03127.1 aminoglycoside phosphotransferase (APT) family kinase protein [Paenibacillus taichungensis]